MPEYTRKEFVDKLRASLPDRYRILSDDKLLEATYQSGYKPEFKPEPQPDPGFIDGLVQPAKEQFYRIPETAASVYNSITEQMYPNDPEMQSIRKDLYEAASQYSNELVQSDDRLQTFQKWASENPFEWGKFFTNPTMFSSTFSSVATSMGAIIGAGALGEVLAGPAGGIGAGLATAYALESSEAYRQTYDRAKAKGYSDEEIDKLSADSAFMYGIGSSIFEVLVPLSILKSFGISKRIAKQSFGKFASKYIDDVVAGNGGDAIASGARAWQQYALESISMAQRLKTYAPILGESLTEASTEGAQYLLEEGIVDNMVDGSEITLDWISSKLSTPEFSQSIAGGLLGGGVFSGGARLSNDAIYGTNGTQVANAMHALGKKKELPDEIRQKIYDSHIQRDDISHVDKVDFAKRLIELEGNDAVDQAVSEADKVTTPSEPVEPKVAEQKAKPEPKVDQDLSKSKTTEATINEDLRTKESAGAANLYPTYDDYKKEMSEALPGEKLMTEREWFGDREEQIRQYVEGPAIPLVKKLLNLGGYPYSSNVYGPGPKGVWYKDRNGVERFAPLEEKPTQKPQEPPRSTQKEKPAPSIPKQSKPAGPLIEPNSIPSKLVNPDRGRVTEIPGADTKEKAYNWMVVEGSDSVKKQLSKLSPNDKQTVLGLAASALIETAEKPATPEKARQYFYNKDGTVNEARLMDAIDALGEKGVFIETKTVSEGLGQPTQVRSRVIKPKEYMFDIIKSIEESGAISEIESGVADEILKPAVDEAAATQADDIIKGQVSEVQAPVDIPKQERTPVTKDKQAARVINENKLKTKRIVKPADYLIGKKPNEAQDQLLRKIMPLLKNLDVIEFEGDLIAKSKVGKGGKSNGMYPDGAKSILINKDAPDPVRTFIHESVHYLTANAVNNPKNDKDRAFKKRIGEIRKIATIAIVNKSSSFKYLSQNDAEFIAGALAEPDFQKELARIDSDKKGESLWSDFINAVKRLLGITRSNTLLDETINEVIGYVEKQVKPEIKAESRKKSPPNPKPKKNVDTGEFTGKEIDIKGHDITEKDDLEGFSQLADEDLSYSTNSESDLYQLEDDRDGIQGEEATSETESNPREFFFTSFGVYLTEPQYGKIADYAKKFSNLTVSNRQELDKFYDMLDSNLKSMIKEMTGNDPIIENQDKHSKEIREWFQKTVSRQPVMFDAVSGKGRNKLQMLLRVVDGSVIGKALQPLMRVKLDTARRDDAGNLVGGKKHGKTDAISFIEYDQYKYGAKTKLFYLNVNDIYTEEIARTFTGKIFSKFRKASPFEWSLTGEQVRNMNDDFANAFLSGKDKFLKVFFAERSGDNSKVMIAAVPATSPFAKYTRDDLEAMLRDDASKGYLYTVDSSGSFSSLSDFTNHSGGAVGADTAWMSIGAKFGLVRNNHYYVDGNKTPNGNFAISKSEAIEADSRLNEANKTLNRRFPTNNEYVNNLLRRNWSQVKNSDSVYAISTITSNIVDGGTGWAVQMAIDNNKPVYVYDQEKRKWFTWDNGKFIETETPTLTKNFAGIGTRNINSFGLQAIKDVFEKTSSSTSSNKPEIDHVQQFLDSGDALVESNPLIYAQLAILHDKWKNIKGFNYLTRFKDVASAYKRLKIDTTEGTMIRGIGDSTIYIIDPNEVDIARVIDGVEVPVKHLKPDGSSAFDGAIWSSARRMRKINHALGSNSYVFKTFIRFLEMDKTKPGYGIDYIGVKMAEFHPEPGMRVKQKGTNKILASYDGNIWKDRSGKEFEILATPDEVKDRSGIYSQNYTVLNLPEHATILKMSYDKSKTDGAHPVAAHELSLDPNYIESNDFAKKYLQSVFNHYRSLIKDTVDYLYSLRPDPIFTDMTNEEIQATKSANIAKAKAIRNIVQKELKPGQKLMEMDIVAEIFENGEGFYMPNFMKQLIHSLSNKFIVNGLFKARQMKKGNATKLLIKPNVGYNIPEDGVIISSQNKTFYSNVKKAYLESSDISLDGMPRDEEVAQINNWLKDNPYYVLVHRQPIQSFTKVVPRKISEFSTGLQGETIIMNLEDVFYLHDGDHDGDSVFVERFDNDLVDTMLEQARQDKFRARNRTVDLGIFEKGDLGKSLADINSVYKLIADRQSAAGAQGMAVNIKTALARFAYKGFKLEFSNGQKMEAYNPTDKSIMWYLPLSQEYLDSKVIYNGQEVTVLDRIRGEGDGIIAMGSKKYLVTTRENEFSILLQAAVDNDKFNLLSKIPLKDKFGASISLHSFMLSRIFKMSEGEVINKNNFTREQLKTLKVFFDIFNVSTLRSGNDSDRSKLDMNGVINESEIYTSLYYVSGSNEIKPAADISNALLQKFRSDTYRRKGFANIKNVSVNNKLTPSDMLVMAPAIRHRQLSETLSQYQEGLALNGPLLATDPMYKLAHFETMNQMSEWIQEQYNSDKSDIREIINGIKFADKVGTAFYDSFSKAEAGTKSVMSKNDDAFNVKYDYDEGIQNNVIEPYQQEFNELSDIAKRWSSIRFMDGINYNDTKLSTTIKLLPMQLMDKGVVKEYGTRYMHNIYNSAGSGTMRGAEARSRDLAKIFADIRTQSRELGENHSIGKLESKKDNYCG